MNKSTENGLESAPSYSNEAQRIVRSIVRFVIDANHQREETYLDLPGAVLHNTIKNASIPRTDVSKSDHAIDSISIDNEFIKTLKLTAGSKIKFLEKENDKTFKNIEVKETQVTPHSSHISNEINSFKSIGQEICFADVPHLLSCLQQDQINKNQSISNKTPLKIIPSFFSHSIDSFEINTSNIDESISFPTLKRNSNRSIFSIKCENPKFQTNTKIERDNNVTARSNFELLLHESLSSVGSHVCRICMTAGREILISPCNCKGSLASVHLTCLERWLNQVGRNRCELCGYSYPAVQTLRYTVIQAVRLWFRNPRNRMHLQSDCLIFWLLSVVTAGLIAVCIIGTQYFVIEGKRVGISHRITETAMDFFMAIVLCGYSITVYLLWKDHYVMWNRWRKSSVNVRLLLTPNNVNNTSRTQSPNNIV